MRRARYSFYQETLFDYREHPCTFPGSFVGVGLLRWLNSAFLPPYGNLSLIASFKASVVLTHDRSNSPATS